FYGKGAGKLPTASAVVADVVDCCKHLKTRKFLFWADGNGSNIIPYTESKTAVYVRIKGENALDKAEKIFGAISVIKREDVPADEAAFVTTEMPYGDITEKIEALKNEGVEVLSTIRIGDL
ncbi:MAG TPA: homoserine dehydrogenase, partial [Ruminococcus sp.]|nr:homoserine dehydrogenase [Ruminococcus sp.]